MYNGFTIKQSMRKGIVNKNELEINKYIKLRNNAAIKSNFRVAHWVSDSLNTKIVNALHEGCNLPIKIDKYPLRKCSKNSIYIRRYYYIII